MNRYVNKTLITCGLLGFSFLTLLATPINAQSSNTQSVRLEPAWLEYTSAPDQEQKFSVTLNNTSTDSFDVRLSAALLITEGNTRKELKINKEGTADIFSFTANTNRLELKPNQKTKLQISVKVKKNILLSDVVPAINIQLNPIKKSGSPVNVRSQMMLPILTSFDRNLAFDLRSRIVLNSPLGIAFTNNLNFDYNLDNRQNRFIRPVGRIELVEGNTRITASPVELAETLHYLETTSGSKQLVDTKLSPLKTHKAYFIVTDNLTGQVFVTEQSFFYLPYEYIIVAIVILMVLIVSLIALWLFRIRRSTMKQKRG